MKRTTDHQLGDRAVWGGVGYAGHPHAPASGTYVGFDAMATDYETTSDAGSRIGPGAIPGNLHPLIAAAVYETAFALEAGPLSTWKN